MQMRWQNFRRKIKQLTVLLTISLLVLACNRATQTPIPPATPVPPTATAEAAPSTPTFATNLPTPTTTATNARSATGSVTQGAIFTSPRYSYTVVLPCCWLALPTPGTAIESALAELNAASGIPIWGDLGERVRDHESGAVLELLALLPDAENLAMPVAQLTVSVLPTYGLTLDDYAAATAAELTSIANTTVLTAHIEATLGVRSFPASVIEYTAAPIPGANEDEQPIAGLQVAFFGEDAATLIVLTFTTTIDRFVELQPEFLHIARTVTLNSAAL